MLEDFFFYLPKNKFLENVPSYLHEASVTANIGDKLPYLLSESLFLLFFSIELQS